MTTTLNRIQDERLAVRVQSGGSHGHPSSSLPDFVVRLFLGTATHGPRSRNRADWTPARVTTGPWDGTPNPPKLDRSTRTG